MKDSVFENGHKFEFFQAVRVLSRLYPDREPVGYTDVEPEEMPGGTRQQSFTREPGREVARFSSRVTLAFPASEIHEIVLDDSADPQARVTVNFFGLMGPLGVLPRHYTELILYRVMAKKDVALRDFLDIFNHRLLSLFYRAWEKYRFPIAYELGRDDRFTSYLFALIGMGTPGLQGKLALDDQALLPYAGLLSQRPCSASALETVLRDFFGCPVQVIQFQGAWVRLDEENQTRLGVQNHALGISTVCGARVWDRQSKFRVRVGPLLLDAFMDFLPGGRSYEQSAQLARLLAGLERDFDMQLSLAAGEVPPCRLAFGDRSAARLGWSTWLKTKEFRRDACDTILACNH